MSARSRWSTQETTEMKRRINEGVITTVDMMKYFPGRSIGSVTGKMQRLKSKGGKAVKMPVRPSNLKANNDQMRTSLDDSIEANEEELSDDEDESNALMVDACETLQLVQVFEGPAAMTILVKHMAGVTFHVKVTTTGVTLTMEHADIPTSFLDYPGLGGSKVDMIAQLKPKIRQVTMFSFKPLNPASKITTKMNDPTTKAPMYYKINIFYADECPIAETL